MPCDQFSAKRQNKRQSSIDVVSGPPPKSPVSSSQDDVVPHIIIRLSHLQLGKFVSRPAKRVLQHNLPIAAIGQASLEHFVGGNEQTRRHGQAERLSCLEVHGGFILCRRL